MPTAIHRRVEILRKGEDPGFVARVPSGWVVLGDFQRLRGYCVLLADPVVGNLNELRGERRVEFLSDMALVGDVVLALTGALRINYEILGNLEPALHAHVLPRFADEPADKRTVSAFFYDWKAAPPLGETEKEQLKADLASGIAEALKARSRRD